MGNNLNVSRDKRKCNSNEYWTMIYREGTMGEQLQQDQLDKGKSVKHWLFQSDANAPQAGRPGEVSLVKILNQILSESRLGADTESESSQEQCQR